MKMTESEASRRYCPTSIQGGGDVTFCRGDACMAWRWVPKAAAWVENGAKVSEITRAEGYCGLAGVWS